MRELDKHDRETDKQSIELQQQKQQEKELTFLNRQTPKKGHRVFEINTKTLQVVQAEYVEDKVIHWHQAIKEMYTGQIKKTIVVNKSCVYISALNSENALDRFKQKKGSSVINDGTFHFGL